MILGIGIDLVSVGRIEHLMLEFKEKFAEKIFTKKEILQANKIKSSEKNSIKRAIFYAKRFAAKEAFAKATGLGLGRGVDFKDIEVTNGKLGNPLIKIINGKEKFLEEHFNCKKFNIHLSLTDENPLASAIVIIEKIS